MGRLLIVSQVYPPESAAVGQYLADLAEHLVRHGRPVTVVTSASGYTDPSERYPSRETLRGVDVLRLPAGSFGKGSMAARLGGAGAFLAQAIVRSLGVGDVDRVLVSTSPPMAAVAGLAIAELLRVRFTYWVMDVNPDQAVEMGHFSERHPAVRAFDSFNALVLGRADVVVTLDSYMAERLRSKRSRRIEVIRPWPLGGVAEPIRHEDNPFRERHRWRDKTVVMFSGNMSATSPIDTMVDAAMRLRHRDDVVFAFIGGGDGRRVLDAAPGMPNMTVLPYQPLDELRYSLSAADLQVATMGNAMVGITHPCKVYTAMAVGRPILAVASASSHIGELAGKGGGWQVEQGDGAGFAAAVEELAATPRNRWEEMGLRNRRLMASGAGLRERMARLVS